jgi:hypothetical protein
MTGDPPSQSDGRPTDPDLTENSSSLDPVAEYDPGETLGRAMNLGCTLILIALALVSCGFIASVLSLHR